MIPKMKKPLRVLIIEDSEDDAVLLLNELRHGGYNPIYERVQTPEAMMTELKGKEWDVVLSDYSMPPFNGMDALNLLQESEIDVPFIIVSGAISEETAVELMRAGAHDYVRKGKFIRLIPAIERELREAEVRRIYRQAENTITIQNEFLRNILESITNPFYVINAENYKIVMANSTAKLGNLQGNGTCYSLTHQSDTPCQKDTHQCPLDIIKKTRKPVVVTHLHTDSKGNTSWLELHGFPIFDKDGKIIQLIEYTLDITPRKKVEHELQASQEKYKLITENANDLIAVTDKEFNLLYLNQEPHRRLLGYSTNDFNNLSLLKYINRSDVISLKAAHNKCLNKGEAKTELRLTHKNGTSKWFEATLTKYTDSNGKELILTISRDISERKALEESRKNYMKDLEKEVTQKTRRLQKETKQLQNTLNELKTIQKRLIESEKLASIGLLSAGIAHEINNPIMGIINYAQIIQDELNTNKTVDTSTKPYSFIEKMIKEGERISEIVADLLAFSREDTGNFTTVDLSDVINSSISLLYPKLKQAQVKIDLEYQKDIPKIPMRVRNVQQVILNLLQNSIDALNEKYGLTTKNGVKNISIKTSLINRQKRKYGMVRITDNGIGIQAKHLRDVFKPFFTTKSDSKEHGTGLGLSISQSIIKSHGGDIKMRSKWKKNTSIEFTLPLERKKVLIH